MSLTAFWLFFLFLLPGRKDVIPCSSLRIPEVRQQCCFLPLLPASFPPFFCLYVCRYFLFSFSLCVCVPQFSLIAFCSDCAGSWLVCVRFVQPFLSSFCLFQWLLNQLPSLESIEVMWCGVA